MIAVQGVYEEGRLYLTETAPAKRANVIVIFPEISKEKNNHSQESAKRLFEEFTGSLQENMDEKTERMSALDEKYSSID